MLNGVAVSCLLTALLAGPGPDVDEIAKPQDSVTKTVEVTKPVESPRPVEDKHGWLTKHPTISRLHELQNQERARYGLPRLRMNPELCLLAQRHAVWMADTGWYMHSSFGIPEIIHSGPLTPDDAVNGWIWSPAHHGIMLSGTQAGFGYMVRNGVTYWVTLVQ